MKAPFIRNPYNYDMNKASDESGLKCLDKTRTQQHHKDECDINTIVRRFALTGQLPDNIRIPKYGDFDVVNDYHSAMNAVATANEAFDALPAAIRTKFQNDPGAFVDFCSDEANREELIKMGLIERKPEPPTPPSSDAPAPGTGGQ